MNRKFSNRLLLLFHPETLKRQHGPHKGKEGSSTDESKLQSTNKVSSQQTARKSTGGKAPRKQLAAKGELDFDLVEQQQQLITDKQQPLERVHQLLEVSRSLTGASPPYFSLTRPFVYLFVNRLADISQELSLSEKSEDTRR